MIKLQELTPKVFYTKSRDFQFIGRLYDIVLNAAKTDADAIRYINDTSTCDSTLLNLLASTLGFKATTPDNQTLNLLKRCPVVFGNPLVHAEALQLLKETKEIGEINENS